jgi:hypothetical protein
MANQTFQLGNTVRDIVTGITGIATSRVEYLNGCIQIGIRPKAVDNKAEDSIYVDIQQVEYVDDGILTIAKTMTGGPAGDAPKAFGLADR